MNYKIVVPELVSLETSLDRVRGFYLLKKLNYFGNSKNKLKFHFKVAIDDKIKVPSGYDFRNSRYQVKNNIWTYNLSKFGLKFTFQYDYFKKDFRYSPMMNKIPIRLNWTYPIGDHIADLINLDLFLNKVVILNGIAFRLKGKIYVFCAPSQNGKTIFLKRNKETIEEIISDDYVAVDLINKKVASTPLLGKGKNKLSENWYPVEKINLLVNSVNDDKQIIFTVREFVKMSATKFFNNIFIKNLIFYYHLEKEIDDILDKIALSDIFEITNIKNYDYEQLFRS